MRLIKQLLALAALVPGLAFAQAPIKVGIANDLSGPFAALGAEALGKSWQSAAPVLAEGGKAIGEMVEKGKKLSGVTREMAEEADRFNDQMEEMKVATSGLGMSMANGAGQRAPFAPALCDPQDELAHASTWHALLVVFEHRLRRAAMRQRVGLVARVPPPRRRLGEQIGLDHGIFQPASSA